MTGVWSRALWLKNRLASMTPGEIRHRVAEQAKRRMARSKAYDFSAAAAAGDALPAIPGLRDGLAALTSHAELRRDWREAAERARDGRFRFMALEWPQPLPDGPARWHLDPVSGTPWPSEAYCFDIGFRYEQERGDIKYVAELNRLQYLQPSAALAALLHDGDLAAFCLNEIDAWIAGNPPYRGLHWASGIELALRATSMIMVVSLLGPESIDAERRRRLRASFAAHGFWLMRYPSLHSSANNHLIAEIAALYLLGALIPDLPDAARWKAYGRRALEREALIQISSDGVGVEQAISYTALTVDWLLLCALVADRLGEPLPKPVIERLRQAGRHVRDMLDEAGNHPRIGDDDDSSVIRSRTGPEPTVVSVLAGIAAFTKDASLTPPVVPPHLRLALYGLPPARLNERDERVTHYPDGGLSVAHLRMNHHQTLWVLDHGPLGWLSIAAHGHADTLALWLHVDGRPILVDAGTYLYYGAGVWRNRLRGTAAHNTLCLEDTDSSTITGPFTWGQRARAEVLSTVDEPAAFAIEASHDGYRRAFGVDHVRTVERLDGDRVRVSDRLHGSGNRTYKVQIGWLLAPEVTCVAQDDAWHLECGPVHLRLRADGPLSARLEETCLSRAFGAKEPSRRLLFEGSLGVDSPQKCVFSFAS